ncbi:hypothetical protein M0G43_06970 [Subsaxibacter sp. CAU 1640]|uniref:hypothetical protein n=1 Tax=Subsaxibacter sp. CAU 1640 TaxID=2933271 RepID=UPI002002AB59|nr:hypothetical protein [Subsaxibacter sp. CAU 1640]MCK7590308.1 hypothetical protein [Subsaxibacter sp. CAU 1640]
MAPIKYEEQMKDKLEKRSLQPSAESWATLAKRLDEEQHKKNNSRYWWIGVAASVVGILFISILYFNNSYDKSHTPAVVDVKNDASQSENVNEKNQIAVDVTKEDEVVADVKKSKNESVNKSDSEVIKIDKKHSEKSISEEIMVAEIEKPKPEESIKEVNEIKNTTLTFENQMVQDVVAQIKNLKSSGKTVTDTEIDSLLKQAQKEILSNRLYNENTRTVDANALLQDVEEDLQQSFRSKVFEALQSGYESVRTAVAERNN